MQRRELKMKLSEPHSLSQATICKELVVHVRGWFSEAGAKGTEEFGVTNQLSKTNYDMLGRTKT